MRANAGAAASLRVAADRQGDAVGRNADPERWVDGREIDNIDPVRQIGFRQRLGDLPKQVQPERPSIRAPGRDRNTVRPRHAPWTRTRMPARQPADTDPECAARWRRAPAAYQEWPSSQALPQLVTQMRGLRRKARYAIHHLFCDGCGILVQQTSR